MPVPISCPWPLPSVSGPVGTYFFDGAVVVVPSRAQFGQVSPGITADGIPLEQWLDQRAWWSADKMLLEKQRRLHEQGKTPSAPLCDPRSTRSDCGDQSYESHAYYACLSKNYYVVALRRALNPTEALSPADHEPFVSPAGIAVYTQERIAADKLAADLKQLQATEAMAIDKLKRDFDAAQLAALSAQMATDPVAQVVLQQMVVNLALGNPAALQNLLTPPVGLTPAEKNPVFAAAAEIPVPAGAREVLSLPIEADNARTQKTQRDIEIQNALRYGATPAEQTAIRQALVNATVKQYLDDPLNWNPIAKKYAQTYSGGNAIETWARKAPLVGYFPEDNPHIDYWTWATAWETACAKAGNCELQLPLVVLRVTPKALEMPKAGFLEKNGVWIGAVLKVIPFVGPALSAVVGAVSANQAQERGGEMKDNFINSMTQDAFEPSYFPRPFAIVLPLDMAQIVVREPQYTVPVYNWYRNKKTQAAIKQDFWTKNAWLLTKNIVPRQLTGLAGYPSRAMAWR